MLNQQQRIVLRVVEVYTNPRYPVPHEGKREIERRRKQIEKAVARRTAQG